MFMIFETEPGYFQQQLDDGEMLRLVGLMCNRVAVGLQLLHILEGGISFEPCLDEALLVPATFGCQMKQLAEEAGVPDFGFYNIKSLVPDHIQVEVDSLKDRVVSAKKTGGSFGSSSKAKRRKVVKQPDSSSESESDE
jgi:hypothetical protein